MSSGIQVKTQTSNTDPFINTGIVTVERDPSEEGRPSRTWGEVLGPVFFIVDPVLTGSQVLAVKGIVSFAVAQ